MHRGCLIYIICNSNGIYSFVFKLCITIVNTLKMCTSYVMQISQFFFHFFFGGGGILNLDIFLFKMLRWCLVCVMCNSNSFHSLLFKLCIMIVHTLNMYTSFLCTFDKYFLIFRVVELRYFSFRNAKGVSGLCNQ